MLKVSVRVFAFPDFSNLARNGFVAVFRHCHHVFFGREIQDAKCTASCEPP